MDVNYSIDDLIIQFIGDQDISDGTIKLYQGVIHLFFDWAESEGYDSHDISRPIIIRYKQKLFEEKKSSLTIDYYLTVVRRFFTWTEINDIHPNVARGVKNPKKYKGFKKQPLNIKQVRQLLRSIPTDTLKGSRDYALINLMIRSGLRAIEVSRLQVKDITKRHNKIGLMVQGKGRHAKDAYIRLSSEVLDPIRRYLKKRRYLQDEDPLFASIADELWIKKLKSYSISRIIKQRLRVIGLDSNAYTAHSLRHTTAVLALKSGADLYRVQIMLRHSSPSTTQLYTRYLEEEMLMENEPGKKIDIMIGKI